MIEAFLGFFGGPRPRVARIQDGCPVTVADGLPSYIDGTGGVVGVSDVAILGGQLYATVDGGGAVHGNPDQPAGLYRINADGTFEVVADLSAWMRANPVAERPAGDDDPDGEVWHLLPTADEQRLLGRREQPGTGAADHPCRRRSPAWPTCRRGIPSRPGIAPAAGRRGLCRHPHRLPLPR